MLVDINENVKIFLSTILKLDQDMCLKEKINYIYNSLDSVDIDLCIPYLKGNLFYKEIADEIVELIDYYYSNIEENINNFKSLKKRHKPHTKEWCENIRKGLEKKPIFCVELGIVFRGQTDAQRKLGIFQTNIGKVLLGKRKTAGGYHWQYV